MSIIVPLDPVPNQSLSIRLDGARYVITVKDAGGVMVADIDRDGVRLVSAVRCVAGFPLLPYPHLVSSFGNFIFTNTDPGELPDWADFGSTCHLVYSTTPEIVKATIGVVEVQTLEGVGLSSYIGG